MEEKQLDNRRNNLKQLMQITLLSTVGALLMLWQLPYPGAAWLKFDLSDIPALIGGCALGPWVGFAVVLFKSLIFLMLKFNTQELVGIPMSIISSGAMVLVTSFLYQRSKTQKNALYSVVLGIIALVLVMIPANYFVLPFFMKMFFPQARIFTPAEITYMILYFIIPFNAVKGILNGALTFLIYKRIALFLRPGGDVVPVGEKIIPPEPEAEA